jgi:hypothetical protein
MNNEFFLKKTCVFLKNILSQSSAIIIFQEFFCQIIWHFSQNPKIRTPNNY